MAEWTTTPDPSKVADLRRHIRSRTAELGMPTERAHDVTLAVSEIVSNAVLHAYRDGSDGVIRVATETDEDGCLKVLVIDDGMGLSPRPDSPGAGLGLLIAGSVADHLLIETPQTGGTHISMTFALAA